MTITVINFNHRIINTSVSTNKGLKQKKGKKKSNKTKHSTCTHFSYNKINDHCICFLQYITKYVNRVSCQTPNIACIHPKESPSQELVIIKVETKMVHTSAKTVLYNSVKGTALT